MEKIIVVTVMFNDFDYLEKQLVHLQSQTYPLYIVVVVDNNSNEENRMKHSNQANNMVEILWQQENLGGAGGFESGMKYAFEKYSPDWIWIMDADAYPESDCLERLMNCSRINDKTGIIAPIIYGVDLNEYQLYHLKRASKYLHRDELAFSSYEEIENESNVDADAFVGPLISKNAINELGFPEGRLFIYGDDFEYTYRISRKYDIIIIKEAIINHRDQPIRGQHQPHNWWKDYYMFRNRYLIINEFGKSKFYIIAGEFLLTLKLIKKLGRCFIQSYSVKTKKIYCELLVKAFQDGIKGISGKTVDPDEFRKLLSEKN